MKRTRSKDLSGLVIRKADLTSIWALFERHANATGSGNTLPPPRPKITVKSAGSITTESDTPAIFDNDVIDQKRSNSVNFDYTNYSMGKTIRVQLREGAVFSGYNSYAISGDDPAWVDATFVELERVFDAIAPQSMVFNRLRWLVVALLALAIGYAGFILAPLLPPIESRPTSILGRNPGLEYFLPFFWIGFFLAIPVTTWVAELWPPVEFDFGPAHFNRKKQMRTRLSAVAALLLLPFALEVFMRFGLGWR